MLLEESKGYRIPGAWPWCERDRVKACLFRSAYSELIRSANWYARVVITKLHFAPMHGCRCAVYFMIMPLNQPP